MDTEEKKDESIKNIVSLSNHLTASKTRNLSDKNQIKEDLNKSVREYLSKSK